MVKKSLMICLAIFGTVHRCYRQSTWQVYWQNCC